jgi:hypothetical protein
MRTVTAFALVALGFAACASTLPIERREYILSRPHGWIEITIEDAAIPVVPLSDEDPTQLGRPEYCRLEVRLDREPYVDGALYPDGDQEPFRVRSGFRIPVPVGTVSLTGAYLGCDMADGKPAPVDYAVEVTVTESMVTELSFDGEVMSVGATRADTAVTLERIYDAVSGGAPR